MLHVRVSRNDNIEPSLLQIVPPSLFSEFGMLVLLLIAVDDGHGSSTRVLGSFESSVVGLRKTTIRSKRQQGSSQRNRSMKGERTNEKETGRGEGKSKLTSVIFPATIENGSDL